MARKKKNFFKKKISGLMQRKLVMLFGVIILAFVFLIGWITYINASKGEKYTKVVLDQQQYNNRTIPFKRGDIVDRNGTKLATSERVYNVVVDAKVITSNKKYMNPTVKVLAECFSLKKKAIRTQVKKNPNSRYIVLKKGVSYAKAQEFEKITADTKHNPNVQGVWLEEDYTRQYPYKTLASDVIGFTTNGNVGSNGIEASYNSILNGTDGREYGYLDESSGFERTVKEPDNGSTVVSTIDLQVQSIVEQHILAFNEEHKDEETEGEGSKNTGVIVMNPQNGEIYAMASAPEFNLNDPYRISGDLSKMSAKEKSEKRNAMWRNSCVSDTYEPGSTFKILTTAAALEKGVVKMTDRFHCPGYKIVEDRRIRCARTTGHGAETFETGIMNSCNPVFMELGERLGAENFVGYFKQFGLLSKTNIDLPGEAGTIMHKTENIGPVELATISFGQSFQITPIQLVTTVSSIINGGTRVTPHFGVSVQDADGNTVKTFSYETHENICTAETSETMRYLLEKVVSEGTGKNAKIEGFSIGGKTATSQTLPRSDHKYISSFLGFAPADNPQVLVLVVINNPQGIYYGGTIAAPVAKEIFENILPYLDK